MRAVPIGSRRPAGRGYVYIKVDGGWKLEHVAVASAAVGRPLRGTEEVHHVNEIRGDNRPSNLAVLASSSDHVELHRKLRLLRAGGKPWSDRMCCSCGPRDASEFRMMGGKHSAECRRCESKRSLRRYYRIIREQCEY